MARDDSRADRWVGHPVLAAALKAVLYAVPLGASSVSVIALAQVVPVFSSRLLWLACLGAVAVAVSIVVERLVRRLLPLATLLKLTMLFPDKAPSRYKLARSAGNPEVLAERLARKRDSTALGAAEQVLALITALGNHDRRTRGHSERVRVFADLLAEELHLDQPSRDRLRWASLLHDLGKLSVAATILNKPAKLDDREFTLMQQHPERGAELAAPLLPWLGEWGRGILEHHEKYDGSGYPAGLSGTEISTAGRVVGLVDAFETMTAARPYKKPMATRAARQELTDCAGRHFDPIMVRAFLSVSLPRLVWAMGPLSFLVQLPMLSALAQTGTRASQLGGQAAVTASTVASAGVVATAGVLPLPASSLPEPAPSPVGAVAETSTRSSPGEPEAPAALPPAQVSPTDLSGLGQLPSSVAVEPVLDPAAPLPSDPFPAPFEPVRAPARPSPSSEPVAAPPADPPAPAPSTTPPSSALPAPRERVPPPTTPPPATPPPTTPTPDPPPARPTPPPPSPTSPPLPTSPPPVEEVLAPPEVVLDDRPAAVRTSPGAAVTFHSSDPLANAFQCRLDDQEWIGCASSATAAQPVTWTVFPPNGEHEIWVRAASPRGGWGRPVSTGVFRLAVPPTVELQDPPSGAVATSDLVVRFWSPDPTVTSFACSVDGAAWTACTSPLALTLANGEHSVSVRATSPQWGTGAPTSTGTFLVDAPAPTVTFTSAPAGTVTSSEVELHFVSDQAGSSFACRVDGSSYSPCTSPLRLSLVDGPHHVKVRATTALTGTGSARPVNFSVSAAASASGPATALTSVPPPTTAVASATVEFSSPDARNASFRCSLDGRAAQSCTSPWTVSGLANGEHTMAVQAVSRNGDAGAFTSTAFTVAVPPTVVLEQVPSGTVTTRTVSAAFSSDQPDAVFACAVDGGALVDCTSPWSVGLANGVHTLTVRATDPLTGASSTRTTEAFSVAVPPPSVIITDAPSGTVGRTFAMSFTSDHAEAVFECVADGGSSWSTCASGDTFSLPDGQHTMSVRALADGVVGPPVTTATFTVAEAEAPLAFTGGPAGTTTATTAAFSWTGGPAPAYDCRLDDGAWTACSSGHTLSDLTVGSHTFAVRSTEVEGGSTRTQTVSTGWTVVAP